MKEKILFTGATGFIGRALAFELYKNEYEISCLTRNIQKAQKILNFPVSFYEWKDIHKPPPPSAFENTSTVINLAGESLVRKKWTKKQKRILWNSRVLLTKNLIQTVNLFPNIKTFVQTSAIGYYGDTQAETVYENSKKGSDFAAQLCHSWEKSAQDLQKDKRLLIFRLGLVLSRNGGLMQKLLPLFKWGLGGRLGNGNQWMSWIHLKDLISVYENGIENKKWEGIFNVTTPHPITNSEWTQKLASHLKRPSLLPVPIWGLKILYGEGAEMLIQSQKALPKRLQEKNFSFQYPQLDFQKV